MKSTVNDVFSFISDHRDFRLSFGVVTSNLFGKTLVAMGAVNTQTNERWVPELDKVKSIWPDAQWTPITEQQASLFDDAYNQEFDQHSY